MPVTTGEQRGLLVGGIGMVLMLTLVAWLSSNQKDQGVGAPSSYSVQRHGAKAAYLLLQQSGYKVERWKQPPAQLPADASGALLVLAGPESYCHPEGKGGGIPFPLRGGRGLVSGRQPHSFFPLSSPPA